MDLFIPDPLDYAWVTPRLAVGTAISSDENMQQLAADGVTHVLGLEHDFNDHTIVGDTPITVCWLPQPDDFRPKPPEWFEQGVTFIKEALSKDGTRVYVHCLAGIQRSPTMVMAFLGAEGMPLDKAVSLIRGVRPVAQLPGPYFQSVERFLQQRSARP